MRARKSWVYSPPRPAKPQVPEVVKQRVQAEADRLIEEFKPRYIQPPPADAQFNYITTLYTKWHRNYLYLSASFACPGPNALSPSFEAPFTRLEYSGPDRFNLSYMRYTGKWWEVYQGISLEEAVAAIRDHAHFHPPG